MRYLIVLLLLLGLACGGSPTAPTRVVPGGPAPSPAPGPPIAPIPAPEPTPAPSGITITGTITSTATAQVIGHFSAISAGLPAPVTVSVPGYVTRQAWVSSATPTVDLFPEIGFDLEFYRQLARDNFDKTRGGNETLLVLPQSPSFYMEVEGAKGLSTAVAQRLELVARRIVPAMSGGRLHVVRWETGPAPREPQDGWIMVERRDEKGACGRAMVGASAGHIWLDANGQNCTYDAVFAHEIGHALGFFHVEQKGSMMYPQQRNSNLADAPTELERAHAAFAYARPRGNRDVDADPIPSSGVSLPRVVVVD